MAVGTHTYKESAGISVTVTLTASVKAQQVAYVDGFLGIAQQDGEAEDLITLHIAPVERQFTVPGTLAVSKGDIVYIDTTAVTGHTPDIAAYVTSSGADTLPLFKATADAVDDADGNHFVTGIVLPQSA